MILKGENFLITSHWDSCRIPIYRSTTQDSLLTYGVPDSTDFGTGFFLDMARLSDDPSIQAMADTAIISISSHILPGNIWRYYPQKPSLPPDIDDIALLSLALLNWSGDTADNWDTLRSVRNADGSYGTWLPCIGWHCDQETCAVSNAQLLRWIYAMGSFDPGLENYLFEQIQTTPHMEYYISPMWLWYNWAKFYRDYGHLSPSSYIETARECVVDSVLGRYPWEQNALYTALAITILCSLGEYDSPKIKRGIEILKRTQNENGGWPAFVCWTGSNQSGGFFGSKEMTTVFVLEALYSYKTVFSKHH